MGLLPSFLSGARLSIRIGDAQIAYAQNLSFNDDMQVADVFGLGSHNAKALEPTGYIARGSMTITHYSDKVRNALVAAAGGGTTGTSVLPPDLQGSTPAPNKKHDGNSFLRGEYFNPARLLISQSFNIEVYERNQLPDGGVNNFGTITYILNNCRLANYNIGFSPGSLVQETVSFICTSITDTKSEDGDKEQE